ncbi:hypothetical protein AQUCO_00700664v1, partial [Aquilegia coerulea]
TKDHENKTKVLYFKLGAALSIFVFGGLGVYLPFLAKRFPSCKPGTDFFDMIKAFAAGVILATGCVHVLPDAFASLTSPRLGKPWSTFNVAGFTLMMGLLGALVLELVVESYYGKAHSCKAQQGKANEKDIEQGDQEHVHVHTHATHGHTHGSLGGSDENQLIRHRVISQVLELGIVVHSVVIGIALGASEESSEIKTLLIALSFHQLFEGMGLGGCISEAQFKTIRNVIMGITFAITTPIGVGIGIGISSVYKENSPTALIVEGILNAASAGILIYMAMVDMISPSIRSQKVQGNIKLMILVCGSLFLGAGLMSLLALWA